MTCPSCSIIGGVQGQSFTCVAGDNFYEPVQLVNSLTAQAEDISLWTFSFKIWASWAAKQTAPGTTLISLSLDHGIAITDGPNGMLSITMTTGQTGGIIIPPAPPYGTDIPQNSTVYDFIATDENGLIRTTLRGSFIFTL